jgi:chaperonin GroEL (HSP60 family)
MPVKEIAEGSEVDQQMAALLSNSGAIRAVVEAVEGTLGPKGLDCMLVNQYGGVLVTNDGVTILKSMDVSHPAARMLISAAEHQEEQVGDGTTTTAVIAGALVAEGVNQVRKGVPVTKVVEGVRAGIERALELLRQSAIPVPDLNDRVLEQVAWVSGRGQRDLAELVVAAARQVGPERLREPGFRLADQVLALEGADSAIIPGLIISREPVSREMPQRVAGGRILILDDALEPLKVGAEALGTEAGFQRQLQYDQEFRDHLRKLAQIGVKAIFADRSVADQAEDLLTDLGIIGVQRVALPEWRRLAEMTGARPLKKGSLAKPAEELLKLTGAVAELEVDRKFKQLRVLGLPGQNYVTILVGGAAKEIVGERERIAKDAAGAVQAAWLGGVVPGGGSVELAIARRLAKQSERGLASYGFGCVVEALKRPLAQICINAGINPLEKLEEALAAQEQTDSAAIGIDCEDGTVKDLAAEGIVDPYFVKHYACKSAGEIAEAVLRINTIIKMRETPEALN